MIKMSIYTPTKKWRIEIKLKYFEIELMIMINENDIILLMLHSTDPN